MRQCLPPLQDRHGHIDGAGSEAGVLEIEHVIIFPVFHDHQFMDVFSEPVNGLAQVTAWWQRTGIYQASNISRTSPTSVGDHYTR